MCNNSGYTRRMVLSIIWIVLGIILLILGLTKTDYSFWPGLGGGFLAVGIFQLIRCIRYRTNPEYKEQTDIAQKDERNRYLSMKAWSIAGYVSVLAGAVATIMMAVMKNEKLATVFGLSICFIMIVFVIAYFVLRKKE